MPRQPAGTIFVRYDNLFDIKHNVNFATSHMKRSIDIELFRRIFKIHFTSQNSRISLHGKLTINFEYLGVLKADDVKHWSMKGRLNDGYIR